MKMLVTTASVTFSVLLLAAHAQTPVATHATTHDPAKTAAKTAEHRAETYKGPKVVKNTKALGEKMLHDSKPTSTNPPLRPVAPVKQ